MRPAARRQEVEHGRIPLVGHDQLAVGHEAVLHPESLPLPAARRRGVGHGEVGDEPQVLAVVGDPSIPLGGELDGGKRCGARPPEDRRERFGEGGRLLVDGDATQPFDEQRP